MGKKDKEKKTDKEKEFDEKAREKIRKLEEKIKRLEREKAPEEEEESVAGGLLQNIGKMFGLGGLLKGIEKSPAFKERLKKIDEEVERKIKEAPLKRTEGGRGTPMGIPPGVRGKVAGRKRFVKERPVALKSEGPPPVPKERPADIFDEKDYVKIIAEIPGVEEKDIKIDLKNDILIISVDIHERKYHQELKLPCEPKGKLEKTYKNGILEVKINKE